MSHHPTNIPQLQELRSLLRGAGSIVVPSHDDCGADGGIKVATGFAGDAVAKGGLADTAVAEDQDLCGGVVKGGHGYLWTSRQREHEEHSKMPMSMIWSTWKHGTENASRHGNGVSKFPALGMRQDVQIDTGALKMRQQPTVLKL